MEKSTLRAKSHGLFMQTEKAGQVMPCRAGAPCGRVAIRAQDDIIDISLAAFFLPVMGEKFFEEAETRSNGKKA